MTKKQLNKKEENTTIPKLPLTNINKSYADPFPSPGSDDDMEEEVFQKEIALAKLEKLIKK